MEHPGLAAPSQGGTRQQQRASWHSQPPPDAPDCVRLSTYSVRGVVVATPRDDAPSCATGLLADLRAHWEQLSGAERHLVELASSPIYRHWLSQGGISWEQGDVYSAQAEERSTCISPSEALSPTASAIACRSLGNGGWVKGKQAQF